MWQMVEGVLWTPFRKQNLNLRLETSATCMHHLDFPLGYLYVCFFIRARRPLVNSIQCLDDVISFRSIIHFGKINVCLVDQV